MFLIGGVVKRKHEKLIHELSIAVKERATSDSIYKGKAIRVNYRDEDGDAIVFTPDYCPRFIDTDGVREGELIFPDITERLVSTTLFTPIEYTETCRAASIPLKRGVMLEGPYGVGKSLCANVVAKKCVDNGWTFIYVEDVRDLDAALNLAEMYQPAVVFGEDVDRAVGMERDAEVDRILNTLDGVGKKELEIVTILTTNSVEKINQAMIRPGRIDTVIPVRAPDAHAAARLVLLYGRNMVVESPQALEPVLQPLVDRGANAAVFREVVERAKLGGVRRCNGREIEVDAEDIHTAVVTMGNHMDLLAPREQTDERAMSLFGREVGRQIGAALCRDGQA
jgi:transitional endoplasmic reticulum ATPase